MDTNTLVQEVPVPSWWSRQVFEDGAKAIFSVEEEAGRKHYKRFCAGKEASSMYSGGPRAWWFRERREAGLHDAVNEALKWCPRNWQQLLLEWPHDSDEGRHRLAYTPNEEYGNANPPRQIVTSVGKYLKRHWPHVPDHLIRDIAAKYTADQFKFIYTSQEMVRAVIDGPVSCMSKGFSDRDHHPYEVYDPEFGWHMAIRLRDNNIVGRALCLIWGRGTGKEKRYFVRSYAKRTESASYSPRDEALEAWLTGQGMEHIPEGWPNGAKLAKLWHRNRFVAPYLDADDDDNRRVEDCGEYLCISDEGEWKFNDPNGEAEHVEEEEEEEEEPYAHCEDCGRGIYENDERYYVGRDEDVVICDSCISDYTLVRGGANGSRFRNYIEYYVDDDRAVSVVGQDYCVDNENMPDDIVSLEDGRYAEIDDTVYLTGEDEYYLCGDYRLVELAEATGDGDNYALRSDAWQDDRTEKWYTFDQAKPVCLDSGDLVHPDTVDEDDVVAEPETLTTI